MPIFLNYVGISKLFRLKSTLTSVMPQSDYEVVKWHSFVVFPYDFLVFMKWNVSMACFSCYFLQNLVKNLFIILFQLDHSSVESFTISYTSDRLLADCRLRACHQPHPQIQNWVHPINFVFGDLFCCDRHLFLSVCVDCDVMWTLLTIGSVCCCN